MHLRKGEPMQINMKPSTALTVLITKVLPKLHDTWEHDALVLAIEALEKQMPKKAELCYEDLICPVCGADVEWKRYCEECGQRIDTGDEL